MREISTEQISDAVKEMCIEAAHTLSPDMAEALEGAACKEEAPLGKEIIGQLKENLTLQSQK